MRRSDCGPIHRAGRVEDSRPLLSKRGKAKEGDEATDQLFHGFSATSRVVCSSETMAPVVAVNEPGDVPTRDSLTSKEGWPLFPTFNTPDHPEPAAVVVV
jgi:hypothetical protein